MLRIAQDLKTEVKLLGMRPELMFGLRAVEGVFERLGKDLVITSVTDGKHMTSSRHYSGMAFDARTRELTEEQKRNLVTDAKIALGTQFDVVYEVDHLHVEFDPK